MLLNYETNIRGESQQTRGEITPFIIIYLIAIKETERLQTPRTASKSHLQECPELEQPMDGVHNERR